MKKMFTLLVATAMLSTAFAQYDQKDQRDQKGYDNRRDVVINEGNHRYEKNDDWNKGGYYFSAREKEMQIVQINRAFDCKIQSVKSQFFMSRYQKIRQVRFLEEQRDREIQSVIEKFRDRRNQFNRYDHRDNDHW